MYSPDVHREEAHQVAGKSAEGLEEVDRGEEAEEHIQAEYSLVALEAEQLAGHSFVCFVERMFDLEEARQEGTCPGYTLPVFAVLIFETPPAVTRRTGPSLTVAAEVRKIRSEMSRLDERSEVAVVVEAVARKVLGIDLQSLFVDILRLVMVMCMIRIARVRVYRWMETSMDSWTFVP